jgi:hypothetical protein
MGERYSSLKPANGLVIILHPQKKHVNVWSHQLRKLVCDNETLEWKFKERSRKFVESL